jgi:carbonic anhydrase
MRKLGLLWIGLCLGLAGQHHAAGVDPDAALKKLAAGNQRFVAGKPQHPDESAARRKELVEGQKPFAVVLGCSDSRVAPELIFDQGLGDLFIVRDAGNVADDVVLASIEYAVEHLGVQLVVVLGHAKCGAVTAAVAGGEAEGHLPVLVKAIAPSVAATQAKPGDKVQNCIVDNAARTARQLRESQPVLSHAVHAGKLKVAAAVYDLATGKVEFLH